jgi:hypothetical protein
MLYTLHWCIGQCAQCAVLLRVSKLTISACKTKSFTLKNFSTDGHKLNMLNDTVLIRRVTRVLRRVNVTLIRSSGLIVRRSIGEFEGLIPNLEGRGCCRP